MAILLVTTIAITLAVGLVTRVWITDTSSRISVFDDIVAGRSIAYTPFSIGYFEFAGLILRFGTMHDVVIAQAAIYVLTVLFSYLILCSLELPGRAPLWGALAVALYPNLPLSITKIHDTGISCFLISVFAWLVIRLKRNGLSPANIALAGVLFGAMILVRPNTVTLAPIALLAAVYGRRFTVRQFASIAAVLAVTVGILAAAVVPVKGRFVVFDKYYSSYTFANGTHEHALEGILRDYNGEMAMPQSLAELGITSQGLERTNPALADAYLGMAWRFIRQHPFRYLELEVVKVLNLFRPDFRNVNHSFAPRVVVILFETVIAGLFFVWAALRWRTRRLRRFADGFFLIPMLVLYFAPFVASNTDVRYRVPVDSLFIIDSVFCMSILWKMEGPMLRIEEAGADRVYAGK